MNELFYALGIDGRHLIFQIINFAVLLTVLTVFVYHPLVKVIEERRKKIELGIKGGEQAELIIQAANEARAQKIRDGERKALVIISHADAEGRKRSQEIVHGAESKADYLIKEAAAISRRREQEERQKLMGEAQAIVKAALIKTVELDPKNIDEKLIAKAVHEI